MTRGVGSLLERLPCITSISRTMYTCMYTHTHTCVCAGSNSKTITYSALSHPWVLRDVKACTDRRLTLCEVNSEC